jgi:hypothetical protein
VDGARAYSTDSESIHVFISTTHTGLDAAARVVAAHADLPTPHAPRTALCEDTVFGADEKLRDESSTDPIVPRGRCHRRQRTAPNGTDGLLHVVRVVHVQPGQRCAALGARDVPQVDPGAVGARRAVERPLATKLARRTGANARKNCALISVSAYRTKAAQCASPRRLRIPHLCPMRDWVCVSSALHRLDARSRHTRCTAALAGQAGGARRRKLRSGSASARSMAVGCTRRRTGFCLNSDAFAFGTPPSASSCSLSGCAEQLCSGVRLTAWGTLRQGARRTECRASYGSAPL